MNTRPKQQYIIFCISIVHLPTSCLQIQQEIFPQKGTAYTSENSQGHTSSVVYCISSMAVMYVCTGKKSNIHFQPLKTGLWAQVSVGYLISANDSHRKHRHWISGWSISQPLKCNRHEIMWPHLTSDEKFVNLCEFFFLTMSDLADDLQWNVKAKNSKLRLQLFWSPAKSGAIQ